MSLIVACIAVITASRGLSTSATWVEPARLSIALVIAALIIGSSIVMTVGGGPQLLGLPAFGLLGFVGALIGGLWLLRAIRRSERMRHDDEED